MAQLAPPREAAASLTSVPAWDGLESVSGRCLVVWFSKGQTWKEQDGVYPSPAWGINDS